MQRQSIRPQLLRGWLPAASRCLQLHAAAYSVSCLQLLLGRRGCAAGRVHGGAARLVRQAAAARGRGGKGRGGARKLKDGGCGQGITAAQPIGDSTQPGIRRRGPAATVAASLRGSAPSRQSGADASLAFNGGAAGSPGLAAIIGDLSGHLVADLAHGRRRAGAVREGICAVGAGLSSVLQRAGKYRKV